MLNKPRLILLMLIIALLIACQTQPKTRPKSFRFPDMPPITSDIIIDWDRGTVHGCIADTMPPDIEIPMGCYLIREVDGVPVTEATQEQLRRAVRKALQKLIDAYNRTLEEK